MHKSQKHNANKICYRREEEFKNEETGQWENFIMETHNLFLLTSDKSMKHLRLCLWEGKNT